MNDQSLMENYLLLLKSTVEVYIHGTLESSNDCIRSLLKKSLDNILSSQASTYEKMVESGWYKVTNVASSQITQVLSKLNCN